MGFGGGSGGGSSSIATSTDVALSSPINAQVLTYDGTTAKWKNATSSASGTITADQVIETTNNKVMTAAERTKLGGIATAATANSSDATLLNRANHTGTQSADTLTDGTTNKAYTATERTKLTGIATAATANSTDAQLRDRSTHTGTQSADTITDGTTNKTYTAVEKTKLAGVAAGAEVNVNADWSSNTGDSQILNRPAALPPNGTAGGDLTGSYPSPTLAATAVVSGSYTNTNLTVDSKGRITAASNGSAGGGGGSWGSITGTLSSQTDLQSALNSKEPAITAGATTQYIRGDKSLATLTQDVVPDGTTNKAYTATEKTKLAGIATSATANSSDATLLSRTNHTGTQAISTVTTLQTELDTREVVVRWNAGTNTWAARPSTAAFGAIFLSTNDPDATTPTDVNKQVGDVWRRHPDAS